MGRVYRRSKLETVSRIVTMNINLWWPYSYTINHLHSQMHQPWRQAMPGLPPPPTTLHSHPLTFTTQAKAWPKRAFVQIGKRHPFLKTLDFYLMKNVWNILSLVSQRHLPESVYYYRDTNPLGLQCECGPWLQDGSMVSSTEASKTGGKYLNNTNNNI